MLKLIPFGLMVALVQPAGATWRPEYSQLDPALRQWYRDQRNPKTTIPCCSEADGAQAQEDIRQDSYWVRFEARGIDSGWMEVPADSVLKTPNLHRRPVVWWYFDGGIVSVQTLKIQCYAPGPGL